MRERRGPVHLRNPLVSGKNSPPISQIPRIDFCEIRAIRGKFLALHGKAERVYRVVKSAKVDPASDDCQTGEVGEGGYEISARI